MRKSLVVIVAVLIVGVIAGCGTPGKKAAANSTTPKAAGAKEAKLIWNMEYEPKTLDPQKATDISATEISFACLEGLTRIGENGKVLPGMAESWENKENLWIFHLRKDAKWSNSEVITAGAFYFGIKRAIDPETASEYSYMTYFIKNAQAFNEKKEKDFGKVGVKVIDDYTLQFELERPASYFASIVGTLMIYFPVNEKYYNANKEGFASSAETLLYNGPWLMTEWVHDSKAVFKKNPNYWNKDNIKLDEMTFLMIKDPTTAAQMYKNNEINVTYISGVDLPAFTGNSELKQFSDGTSAYLEMNVKNKILSNAKIRKAIAYVIDRDILVNKVIADGSIKAQSFIPDGFPGKTATFRADYGREYFKDANVEEAKKLFAEGLKELKIKGPVKLKLTCDNRETTQKYMQYVQEQLNKNLGIEITLEPVTFQIRLQKMTSKDFDIVMALWGADYLDPMTFMDLWLTGGGNNHTSWSNKSYDEAIRVAQISGDEVVRMDAMAQAEKVLMEEMPVAPLFFRTRNVVIKPNIKGVVTIPLANNVDFYGAYIE